MDDIINSFAFDDGFRYQDKTSISLKNWLTPSLIAIIIFGIFYFFRVKKKN